MRPLVCTVDDCQKKVHRRAWCRRHYVRWQKHGDVNFTKYAMSVDDAFERYTLKSEGCWLWVGSVHHSGYGSVSVDGKNLRVHRVAWERANGPIPDGMLVDHVCRNRNCVRLEHLRLATHKQNAENIGLRVDNTSGARGVYWHKRDLIWEVQLQDNGVMVYGGRFEVFDDAVRAASDLRRKLFTHSVEELAA